MRTLRCGLAFPFAIVAGLAVGTSIAQVQLPDSSIRYNVQNALRADPRVPASSIVVTTDHGIVTLAGDVPNLAAREYAVAEAKKIDGVLGVIDDIVVTPTARPDTAIAEDVLHRLRVSPVIESENLNAFARNGEVTLTGEVATPVQHQEATLLASEVPGVRAVKNRIGFEDRAMTRRSDAEIRNDATAAIQQDVFLAGMPVDVHVVAGTLSLDGSVGNAYEKRRAADDVRWLPGVNGFRNNLQVEWWERQGVRDNANIPEDKDLMKAARADLNEDYRIDPSNMVVLVSHGQVTLDGFAANEHQKQLAEQDAGNLVGADIVNDNLIVRTVYRGDLNIREAVSFTLDTDRALRGFSIRPYVRRGIVTLSGSVDDWYQKVRAGRLALRTSGVRRVVNNLVVNQILQHSGATLAGLIHSRLEDTSTTSPVADNVNVTVQGGDAVLTGQVATWAQMQAASEIAYSTAGVSRVENRLTVTGYNPPLATLYYWHP